MIPSFVSPERVPPNAPVKRCFASLVKAAALWIGTDLGNNRATKFVKRASIPVRLPFFGWNCGKNCSGGNGPKCIRFMPFILSGKPLLQWSYNYSTRLTLRKICIHIINIILSYIRYAQISGPFEFGQGYLYKHRQPRLTSTIKYFCLTNGESTGFKPRV